MYNNTKRAIFTPIVLAIVLIIGIVIGNLLGIQKSYIKLTNPYMNKLDAILDYIDENYVDTVSKQQIIEKTIPEVLSNLDPHSIYIPAKDFEESNAPLEGNFDGIGVQFNVQNDTVLIVNTISGGPSERLGILAGDRIIKINDTLFVGKKVTSESVMKKLKGKRGTLVKISIKRKGISKLIDFEITRAPIPIYSVDVAYMITKEIGYIKISKFSKTTHTEFLNGINKLKELGMKKVIIDLRGNTGGFLYEAKSLADEFLEKDKLIVFTKGRSRGKQEYFSTGSGTCLNIPVAVLIDSWSASASEIFAGAIQDNDRGIIIGRRSFGKGLVQEPIMFKDGSALRLTIARYYTPTGRSIQRPYTKGNEEYDDDLYYRRKNGELENADSIKFDKKLQYKTPKGKIVYGGGGIMPDIFVPIDTTGYSKYFERLSIKGTIYKFSLEYVDKNRSLLKTLQTPNDINDYLNKNNILNEFIVYAEKDGIIKNEKEFQISKFLIDTYLRALIARHIIDNNGFYPILHEVDNVIKKAVEEMLKS